MTLTNKELLVVAKLVGLARALDQSNSKIEHCDVFTNALKVLGSKEDYSKELKELTEEKRSVVPDCFVCANPCGRTFDMDLEEFKKQSEEIKQLKENIILKMKQIADSNAAKTMELLELYKEMFWSVGFEFMTVKQLEEKINKIDNNAIIC